MTPWVPLPEFAANVPSAVPLFRCLLLRPSEHVRACSHLPITVLIGFLAVLCLQEEA